MGETPLVKMENIHKKFGSIHAVKGVDLEVYSGEIIGLLGNNGAGKSTLIKALVGINPKTSGKIYWQGEEVQINSIKDARKLGIEAVYQEQAVFNQLSIVQNVFMGREPKRCLVGPIKCLDYKTMKDIVGPLLKKLGMSVPSLDHEVRFCSGGERQGVAIARAMHFEAKLVILDEPTTALSVEAAKKVLSFIEHLKNEGISVILISHNMAHVYSVVDRIVVLSHGRKVEDVKKSETSRDKIEDLMSEVEKEGDKRNAG
ncbi:MAG: ATP-binding cassette domain-containing protein [Bacillota bacterium]